MLYGFVLCKFGIFLILYQSFYPRSILCPFLVPFSSPYLVHAYSQLTCREYSLEDCSLMATSQNCMSLPLSITFPLSIYNHSSYLILSDLFFAWTIIYCYNSNENFNLAGVERLISNVAVWYEHLLLPLTSSSFSIVYLFYFPFCFCFFCRLLGLDAKQANDVKLYGKLTLQNFPTVPPFVSNVPILTPSMSYSGSSSSLPTYHPHYSANLISPLPMTSSYNTSNLYDGHLLYPSPFNTSTSTSSYTSTLQTPSIHNSSLNSSYSTTFPLYGSNLTSSPHSTSSLTLPTLLPPSYLMPPFSTGSLSTNWTQLPSTPLPSLFHLSPTPKTYPFQK